MISVFHKAIVAKSASPVVSRMVSLRGEIHPPIKQSQGSFIEMDSVSLRYVSLRRDRVKV